MLANTKKNTYPKWQFIKEYPSFNLWEYKGKLGNIKACFPKHEAPTCFWESKSARGLAGNGIRGKRI